MKTKYLLIAAMLILLISIPIILFNAHSKSGELSKSGMISYESFKGKDELNIPLSNYRLDCPTYAYFGADCKLYELTEAIKENENVAKMLIDNGAGYFLIESNGKNTYFSLYEVGKFIDNKASNSFLIYNGKVNLEDGEKYLGDIFFPEIVLSEMKDVLLEYASASVQIGGTYLFNDSKFDIECLSDIYRSVDIYEIQISEDEIKFSPKDKDFMADNQDMYDGKWKIKITNQGIIFDLV